MPMLCQHQLSNTQLRQSIESSIESIVNARCKVTSISNGWHEVKFPDLDRNT